MEIIDAENTKALEDRVAEDAPLLGAKTMLLWMLDADMSIFETADGDEDPSETDAEAWRTLSLFSRVEIFTPCLVLTLYAE